MDPIVTVIVPTKDRPQPLAQALASIAGQELRDIEVVVVNDGGEDVEVVTSRFEGQVVVRLITLSSNQGLSQARNIGVQAARGRYLAFLDDDDVYFPQHLAVTLEAAEASGADMVYTDCLVSDRRLDPSRWRSAAVENAFDYPFNADMLSVMNYIPVTAVVCRMRPDLGVWFDSTLSLHEDWDLWLRLTRHCGVHIKHIGLPTVIYHRIPQWRSITNDAAADVTQLGRYRASHLSMMERWPVSSSSRVNRYRRWVLTMYDYGLARLHSGRPISHFYYEHSLRVLFEAFTGRTSEEEVGVRLARAVDPSGH